MSAEMHLLYTRHETPPRSTQIYKLLFNKQILLPVVALDTHKVRARFVFSGVDTVVVTGSGVAVALAFLATKHVEGDTSWIGATNVCALYIAISISCSD